MIEVIVRLNGREELARIRITNLSGLAELAEYAVEFAVHRGQAIGLHRRRVEGFPRLQYNVLGLLRLALNTLTEEEMRIEGGFASPSDLLRELPS